MRRVIVAGGSGFIGSSLSQALVRSGREVVVLSRTGNAAAGMRGVEWDARTLGPWQRELEGAEAVVNLTGRPIACRWTAENCREIVASRVDSATVLGKAIAACTTPPKTWINASAVGAYGDSGEEERTEDDGVGGAGGFLAEVCRVWEQAADDADTPQTRRVKLRIGFVLARDGGALPVLAKLTRLFLGGQADVGRQYVSWIHIDDLVGLKLWLLDSELGGLVNATAPKPVTNKAMMAALRTVLHRPWSPPVPGFLLRGIGKMVGPDADLVLHGQRVIPQRALAGGFKFCRPELDEALAELFAKA